MLKKNNNNIAEKYYRFLNVTILGHHDKNLKFSKNFNIRTYNNNTWKFGGFFTDDQLSEENFKALTIIMHGYILLLFVVFFFTYHYDIFFKQINYY